MSYDWEELGLKMGLEVHQQLNTKHKLFCPCSTELTGEDYDSEIKRLLRPTQSELGQIDAAAYHESLQKQRFNYESFNHHTCLVETDDEPPHQLNKEALEISITLACLLNMNVVDEFHTMRKQVIDGSNTSGFQRTGLLATNGYLETPYGKVKIETLGLEEDAARRVESESEYTEFRLDRLGIPLAEITTDPSVHNPEAIQHVAYMIGQVLRSTNVKRGLGTIRQDLNISIAKGARVEIKGVQNLDLMPEIVEREVTRQLKLTEIQETLKKRKGKVNPKIYTVDESFENCQSNIIKNAETVKAVILEGFNGLIGEEVQPGRRFGTELSSYAKKRGVKGLFHTDELPAYGISQEDVDKLKKYLNTNEEDAIIIVAEKEETTINALEEVKRRANLALEGVVEETRKCLEDGNTEYMRPLATANRMYLETDIPLFQINKEYVEKINNNLPELPDEKYERILKEYKLSKDLTKQLVRTQEADMFEEIIKEVKVEPTPVASILSYDLKEIKRDGHDTSQLTKEKLIEMFKLLEKGKISKDALNELLSLICDNPDKNVEELANENNLTLLDSAEVQKIISDICEKQKEMIEQRQMGAMGPIMGMSMKQIKGKADGSTVNQIVKEEIQKRL